LIYTEEHGLVVLSIALFSDPKSLLAATVSKIEDEFEDDYD